MKSFYTSKLIVLIILLSGFGVSVHAQSTTFTFNGTTGLGSSGINGSPQVYSVPLGVTQIAVDMYGGCGGWPCCSWTTSGGPIANGGRVQCTMNVTPGSNLYVYVGGAGGNNLNSGTQSPGGWNGGGAGGAPTSAFCGGGGGESDIRTSTSGAYATSVLVVAGAGGGGGDFGPVGGVGGGTIGGTGGGGACGGGQTGPSCTTGSTAGTQGQGGSCVCYSMGGGGGGWWGGNCGSADNGGGGGSSYPAAPNGVVTAITHTQGYAGATGNGQVIITVLCTSPGSIVGSVPVCPGSTITLSNPTGAGGTWVSSNSSIASINPGTGVLTGVAPGTVTITYSEPNPCGGTSATTTVTVLPTPATITGTTSACTGVTTTLSDGGTGSWTSGNPSVATVSSSGVVTGVSAGTALISYTLTTGCAPATTTVTIYPTPPAIGGTPTLCASGGTSALTDALTGGTWTTSTPTVATVGIGSGVVTGVVAGTATITYTSGTGCVTSTPVTVSPLPLPIGGTASVCVGLTTALTDGTPGGTWSSSNTSLATIGAGSGIATGITAGTPTITYTLAGTGCRATTPLIVNPQPGAITGGSSTCVGAALTLSDAGGGTWTSSNLSVATINTFSGAVTSGGPGTTTITYTLSTGCSATLSLLVNPLPTAYALTGGGSYCTGGTGVHIGLAYASSGVSYTLLRSGTAASLPIPGSNSGLDFGLQTTTGIYTVSAVNSITGCSSNMTGSVTVSVNPLPVAHNITGGGGYCIGGAGSPLGTDGSDTGVSYQLYNGGLPAGPVMAGTGSPLSFGSYTTTGTYTVLATNNTTGCSQWQGSNAIITVTAAPTAYSLTGGGSFCAGGAGVPVGLSSSDAGTLYQLYHGPTPVGSPVLSTGGALNFGLFTTAGTYTAIATNLSGCAGSMTGSVTVIVNPLPAINTVTGGGSFCAGGPGEHVGLSFSTPGIAYSLIFNGSGTISTVGGSGSGLDFGLQTVMGTYTVLAVNSTTLCFSNMAGSAVINVNPLPDNSFTISGSGSYCSGGTGNDITISGSESGVSYQLYKGTAAVGLPLPGTGSVVDFGLTTAPGTYTVEAINSTTGCTSWMTGSAVISVNPLPALHNVTGGGSYCAGGAGADIMLNGSATGVFYQLNEGGGIVNTLSGTGSPLNFGMLLVPGAYTVTAMDSVTGCTRNMLGTATIGINPLPFVDTVTGGGSYCAGGAGFHVGLGSSTAGTSYQLYNSGVPSGAPISGAGTTIDFGLKTAGGAYTVVATNPLTGCINNMYGNALINVNTLPMAYALAGSGNYCAGGSGLNINLGGSDLGVNYQLYRSGVAQGAPVSGVGGALSFGLDTFGNYTATATDTTTGCSAAMTGTVTIHTVTPTVYTVTGGGSYCSGGIGVVVNQSGSAPGVSYQLISGGSPVGSAMPGTGSPLSYGLILTAGSYSVQATDTTLGCVGSMAGAATVVVNSLPVAETVTGGGSFCAGGGGAHVGLLNSVSGVHYQLLNGGSLTGTPVTGTTGSTLDFGLQTTAGTYTATATDITTGCSSNMTGSALISILPTPAPYAITVDNSGNYCAGDTGLHIGLINSQAGVSYQLYRGGSTVGMSVTGTGSALTLGLETIAGTYTVVAENTTTSCTSNMPGSVSLNIVPLPGVHSVTGGGGFCPGGSGVNVGLDGSDAGIYYQLYNGTSPLGTLYGTGAAISFGLQATPGTYSVIANSAITPCQNTMFGNAVVYYDSILLPHVVIQEFPATGLSVSQVDSIRVLVTNGGADPTYQWFVNGHPIAGATNAIFTDRSLYNNDSVSCSVTASGPCGGLTTSKSVIVSLIGVSVKQISASGADIRLLPNPNKGSFSLKGTLAAANDQELTAEVTNMLGQVIYTAKVQAVNGIIDQAITLPNTPANGMYLLNLSSGSEHTVFHFVIEQ